jgi:hypothetical protein
MDEELRLDGNAGAGLLAEVFQTEMTLTWTTCFHCGTHGQMGNLILYSQGPGAVFRCSVCGMVQLKIVRGRDRYWVDMTGVRALELPVEEP